MGMTIEEISYRLQAMITMCTFQDAVGHDLSQKEIKLYNQAKNEAIETMCKYQKIQEIMDELNGNFYGSYLKDRQTLEKIYEVMEDGNDS